MTVQELRDLIKRSPELLANRRGPISGEEVADHFSSTSYGEEVDYNSSFSQEDEKKQKSPNDEDNKSESQKEEEGKSGKDKDAEQDDESWQHQYISPDNKPFLGNKLFW